MSPAHTDHVTLSVRVLSPQSPCAALVGRPTVEIDPHASLGATIERMRSEDVSAVVLAGGGGIVTERDLTRAFGAGVSLDEPAGSIATPHPIAIDGSTTVLVAAALMLNEQVRHLIVRLDDGRTGIISIRDVMAVLLQMAEPHLWLSSLRVAIDVPSDAWIG